MSTLHDQLIKDRMRARLADAETSRLVAAAHLPRAPRFGWRAASGAESIVEVPTAISLRGC